METFTQTLLRPYLRNDWNQALDHVQDVSLDLQIYDRRTPLMMAASHAHDPDAAAVALALLAHQPALAWAPIDHQSHRTVLMHAAVGGNVAVFDRVLALVRDRSPFNINDQDEDGHTIFTLAVMYGRDQLLEHLYNVPGVDRRLQNFSGNDALHLATRQGNVELVRRLLQEGFDVQHLNRAGQSSLFLAASLHLTTLVDTLLEAGAHPWVEHCKTRNSVLHAAGFPSSGSGWVTSQDVMDSLVARLTQVVNPIERNSQGNTPLMLAVHHMDLVMVQALVHVSGDLSAHRNQAGEDLLRQWCLESEKSLSPEALSINVEQSSLLDLLLTRSDEDEARRFMQHQPWHKHDIARLLPRWHVKEESRVLLDSATQDRTIPHDPRPRL